MKNVFSIKSIECDLRSNPNLGSFITYFSGLFFMFLISRIFLSDIMNMFFLVLFVFATWVLLAYYVNVFYFHEEYIRILYFFRFSKRNKYIRYSQIERVRLIHRGGKGGKPMFILLKKGQLLTRFFKPSNSFTHRFYVKRKLILEFLFSKGVKVEIDTVFESDKEILKGKAVLGPPF